MKRKLLFFCGSLNAGGAERVLSEITKRLSDKFEVSLLLYYKGDLFYDIDERVRVVQIEEQTQSKNVVRNSLFLRKFVKHERPDVFVSFLIPFNILSFYSLIGINVPKILCERNDPRGWGSNGFMRLIRYWAYRKASGVVFQTEAEQAYFDEHINNHSIIINNPSFLPTELTGQALKEQKENFIVCVSRIHPQKNLPMLVNAFAKIAKDYPSTGLEIYGDGDESYIMRVKDIISQHNLDNQVRLMKATNKIYEKISKALFFVMTSKFEGMSNAVMEAISIGLPVISTNVSGASEMIKDGGNGYIIDLDDEISLAERMRELLDSQDKRKLMGEKSLEIAAQFDFDVILGKWEEYLVSHIN